jgi:O-antigen/teichoic acid export membrane protein
MDLRRFGRDTIIYGIGTFGVSLSGFVLIPLFTHWLSQSDYGLLLTGLVTVEVLSIFMGLQMTPAFIRFCKEFEASKELGRLFGTSFFIQVLGCILIMGLCIIVLPNFVGSLEFRTDIRGYIVAVCLVAASKSLSTHAISFYRARNQSVKYTLLYFGSPLLLIVFSGLGLAVFHASLKFIFSIYAIAYAITGIFALVMIMREIKPSIAFAIVSELLRFGLPIVVSAVAWFILELSDRYFLAYFRSLEEVAIYGVGYKIGSVLSLCVVTPFQVAYGPFTFAILEESQARKKIARLFFYLMSVLFVVAVSLVIISPALLRLLCPPEYKVAYPVILWILPVGMMTGIYFWASALIHIVKKTYLISVVMTCAMGMNVVMNYLLIPRFGWLGAAIATNISYFIGSVGVFVIGIRFFPVPIISEARVGTQAIVTGIVKWIKSSQAKLSGICSKMYGTS